MIPDPGIHYTVTQIEEALGHALHDGDMEAVEDLLHLLAVTDPHHAELVVEVLRIAVGGRP